MTTRVPVVLGTSCFTLHCSTSISCINKYQTIDRGGYLYTNRFRALIAAWLDVSQRSRDGVRLNWGAREKRVNALYSHWEWKLRYVRTNLYLPIYKLLR